MQSTRCFVAVEIMEPAYSEVRRLIENWSRRLTGVRWSREDQLHITIKFLGDVDNRLLPEVCSKLRAAATSTAPFAVSLAGLGTFPIGRPPRVIWAGIEQGSHQLSHLHQQLDQGLAEVGVAREGRKFTPHLTLGRVGKACDRELLAELLSQASATIESHFDVERLLLLASRKMHGRIVYEPIDRVSL